jgi:integrase
MNKAFHHEGPTSETLARIRQGASLVVGGRSLTAAGKLLGMGPNYLYELKRRYAGTWAAELRLAAAAIAGGAPDATDADTAKVTSRKPPPQPEDKETRRLIRNGARLVAGGCSLIEASQTLEKRPNFLRDCKAIYPDYWDAQFERAMAAIAVGPCQRIREGIRKATAMAAAGLDRREVAAGMKLRVTTIDGWRTDYRDLWDKEYARAMESAIALVKAQAGTDAVLKDPAEYIRRARAVDRWAAEHGRELFAVGKAPTMTTFYRDYYVKVRLSEAAQKTREDYDNTIRVWALFSGDPPLTDITAELLARFMEFLKRLRGRKPIDRVSPNTVRKHHRYLFAVLMAAGPRCHRHRDNAGILKEEPPWVKPPKAREKLPRPVSLNVLGQACAAAIGMEVPRVAGVKPPTWWKALLLVAYNTGLRRKNLLRLRMTEVDWENRLIRIPAERMKSGRPHACHLNPAAFEQLQAVCRDRGREFVFPWPHGREYFHTCLRRLLNLAAIPQETRFGLQNLRQANGTAVFAIDPAAAVAGLGHQNMNTTLRHYVLATSIVAKALDALPQPEALSGSTPAAAAGQRHTAQTERGAT